MLKFIEVKGVIAVWHRDKVLVGRIFTIESGEYMFFPEPDRQGYWEAWTLKLIAEKLEVMNQPLHDNWDEYFGKEK